MIVDPGGGGTPVTAETMVARQMAVVSQQAVQIQTSAKNFAASAGQGFHIEPEAAATLINACRDSLNQLESLEFHLLQVSQAPQLGTSPGASVVAPFTQQTATDNQGIQQAITNLKTTLQDMIQGYQKASTNYAETEALVAQSMKSQQGRLGTTTTTAAPLMLNS